MYSDLIGLSDRVWGWNSDYKNLFRVAIEAIVKHPRTYLHNVSEDFYQILLIKGLPTMSSYQKNGPVDTAPPATIVVAGKSLPLPSEDQLIPASHMWWLASTPDNSVTYNWQNLGNPVPVFRDPEVQSIFESISASEKQFTNIPIREGNTRISQLLNKITNRLYPPMLVWIIIGMIGFVLQFDFKNKVLAFIFAISIGSVLLTVAGTQDYIEYRIPFDPVFILMGTVGYLQIIKKIIASRKYFNR
jgi:energy-converting hydrogenase Eha subunit C